MTLYTSDNYKADSEFYIKKRIIPYTVWTIFCIVIAYVYSLFSHGVTSPYMTLLFLFPLVLGVLPAVFCLMFKKKVQTHFFATHLYHTGVISLALSSILRGIFDIAGTSSIYQTALMIIGGLLLISGFICFMAKK